MIRNFAVLVIAGFLRSAAALAAPPVELDPGETRWVQETRVSCRTQAGAPADDRAPRSTARARLTVVDVSWVCLDAKFESWKRTNAGRAINVSVLEFLSESCRTKLANAAECTLAETSANTICEGRMQGYWAGASYGSPFGNAELNAVATACQTRSYVCPR